MSPVVLLKISTINGVQVTQTVVSLCDTGSIGTLIKDSALPFGAVPTISTYINSRYAQIQQSDFYGTSTTSRVR